MSTVHAEPLCRACPHHATSHRLNPRNPLHPRTHRRGACLVSGCGCGRYAARTSMVGISHPHDSESSAAPPDLAHSVQTISRPPPAVEYCRRFTINGVDWRSLAIVRDSALEWLRHLALVTAEVPDEERVEWDQLFADDRAETLRAVQMIETELNNRS